MQHCALLSSSGEPNRKFSYRTELSYQTRTELLDFKFDRTELLQYEICENHFLGIPLLIDSDFLAYVKFRSFGSKQQGKQYLEFQEKATFLFKDKWV